MLFSLYINDLPERCQTGCQLYADDTVIYTSSSEAAEILSSFLSRVCHWLYDNKLTLNNKKTVSMCFAIKNTPQSEDFCMTLQGEEIEMVKDFKYLGVVLDSRLKFDKHVKKLSKTIKNNLNYFKLFRHHIPIKATQLYMHAMIVSHMSYCVTVGRQAFKTTVKLIASLYNQTLKIMAKKPIKTKIKLTQDIKIFNTNVAYPFQGDREAGDNPS